MIESFGIISRSFLSSSIPIISRFLKNTFSDIKFSIEHVGYLEEPDKNPKASIRWFLEGVHSKDSEDYGKKTNSKLFFMGINHVELNDDGVIREWVLFDEVAIWKQILMSIN